MFCGSFCVCPYNTYTLSGTTGICQKQPQPKGPIHQCRNLERPCKKENKESQLHHMFSWRNLRSCTTQCCQKSYMELIFSVLEYGAIVWDLHLQQDIHVDALERVLRQGVCTGDYRSRTPECVTAMLSKPKACYSTGR